ncbi:unnamed protein product [Laminaria digitata]
MVWGSMPPRMTRVGVQAGLRLSRSSLRRGGVRLARRQAPLSTAIKVPFEALGVVEASPLVLAALPVLQTAPVLACQEPEGEEDGDGR